MKKITKIVAVMAVLSTVFIGCKKPDDPVDPKPAEKTDNSEPAAPETPADPTDEEKETKTDIGFSKLDGWGNYDLSDKTENSVTVSYSGKVPVQYNTVCGGDINFGSTKKVTLTVKNNDSKPAYVKVDVKNDDKGSAVTAATVNGTEVDVQWGGADTTLEANASADFVLTIDPSIGADKFIIALNNNQAENPDSGSITISNAYKYE